MKSPTNHNAEDLGKEVAMKPEPQIVSPKTLSLSEAKPLIYCNYWRLTYQGRIGVYEASTAVIVGDDPGMTEFFDNKKMEAKWIDFSKVAYYEARSERYWTMPDWTCGVGLSDLRDFVNEHPEYPSEVKDSVYSRRPFRTFKEEASTKIINEWSDHEYALVRLIFINFFLEHGVAVSP